MARKSIGEYILERGAHGRIEFYTDEFVPEQLLAVGVAHQPLVLAVDAGESMRDDAGDGRSRLETILEQVNGLPRLSGLSGEAKDASELLALTFQGGDVCAEIPWTPLARCGRIGPVQPATGRPVYRAIAQSVQAARVIRHHYRENGVAGKPPQIALFVGGPATDPENRALAGELCRRYVGSRSCPAPRVRLCVFLVPGGWTQGEMDAAAKDLKELCGGLTAAKLTDCVSGIPAAFRQLSTTVLRPPGAGCSGQPPSARYDPAALTLYASGRAGAGALLPDGFAQDRRRWTAPGDAEAGARRAVRDRKRSGAVTSRPEAE